jgi:hypothetical protein
MRKGWLFNKLLAPFLIFLIGSFFLASFAAAEECTTAVVSGKATVDGRPLLWKNRDVDEQNNKLVFLTEGPFLAIGLANATSSTSIWMGVNEKGFAIENSDSEDLGSSGAENGTFLRYALLHCATVDDYETLLLETNISGPKTRANCGVIDASGNAAIFEVGSNSFHKFDASDPSDAPYAFIVRTNFAFTGDGTGTGYIRYEQAVALLTPQAMTKTISHEFILRTLARDLNNGVIDPYPLPYEGSQDGLPTGYIRTNNSINRYLTRSCGIFHGVLPGENPLLTTMWVILGEPVCSVAVPVWVMAGSLPQELSGSAAAPFCDAAIVKKAYCYPLTSYPQYINTYRVDDGLAGGVFSFTLPTEDWTLNRAQEVLIQWRAAFPLAQTVVQVQNAITKQAYWCLLSSSPANEELSSPRNLICWTFQQKELRFGASTSGRYLHLLRWRSPSQGEVAGYRVYDVSSGQRNLLAEIPGNTFSFFRRVSDRTTDYIYAVLAVDNSGKEGSPACVQTQFSDTLRNLIPDKSRLPFFKLALPGHINCEAEIRRLILTLI